MSKKKRLVCGLRITYNMTSYQSWKNLILSKTQNLCNLTKLSSGYLLNVYDIEIPSTGVAISMIQRAKLTQSNICIDILDKMYNELKEYLPSKDVVEKEANDYRRTHGQTSVVK